MTGHLPGTSPYSQASNETPALYSCDNYLKELAVGRPPAPRDAFVEGARQEQVASPSAGDAPVAETYGNRRRCLALQKQVDGDQDVDRRFTIEVDHDHFNPFVSNFSFARRLRENSRKTKGLKWARSMESEKRQHHRIAVGGVR